MGEFVRALEPEPKSSSSSKDEITTVGKTSRVDAELENWRDTQAATSPLPRHDFDQDISLGPPFEFSRGKATAALKLDAKASAFGQVKGRAGSVTAFDAKLAHAFFEDSKSKYRNKVSATLGKMETAEFATPLPGWNVKVEAAAIKVGNAKVEGPSVSIVAWTDVSGDLPAAMRERCKLKLEIKVEMSIAPKDILKALEGQEKLLEEARTFEQTAREEKAAYELARKEVRVAEQALDRARLLKTSNRAVQVAEATEKLRLAKVVRTTARASLDTAFAAAERLAIRCKTLGLEIAERSMIYSAVERAVIRASERWLVRVVGHALGYLIPIVDVGLVIYDLVQLGFMINEVVHGRARFGLSGETDEFYANLQPGAAWIVGILEPGGKEIHPTKEQAERLNAAIPNDLTPAEQQEIRERWKAMGGKLDDLDAGIVALKKLVDEVRAKTRAPVTPDVLNAADTNPGAQRIAAALGGSGILSGEEYRILCETIPADLTMEELAKLKPYLQRKGQKADVRLIGDWIRELRAGEKIRIPPPGSGNTLLDTGVIDGASGAGGDTTKKVEAPATTGSGDAETQTKTKAKKPGGGGGASTQKAATPTSATPGVLVPTTQTGTTKTQVHFRPVTSLANVRIGDTVRIAVSVPSRGIARTMSARVVARGGGHVTVELVLGQRMALQRSVKDFGPIFEARQRITF